MKDIITYDDFLKLDIRVGEIVEACVPEWSKKLLKFTVDFGEEVGKRTIFSGIKDLYQPEEMMGKKGVFIVNLAPKKMGPVVVTDIGEVREESQGMWLMSDTIEKPVPIIVDNSIANGTVVR
jgi:methionyl-tRNA synthetase